MTNFMKAATLVGLFMSWTAKADVVVPMGSLLTITMPDSYRHVAERGTDSAFGKIITNTGIMINYDLGKLGGSSTSLQEMSKAELASVLYFKDHPANAPTGFILIRRVVSDTSQPPNHVVELALGKGVGSFHLLVSDVSKLKEALIAVESLKIDVPKQPTPKAETPQPYRQWMNKGSPWSIDSTREK